MKKNTNPATLWQQTINDIKNQYGKQHAPLFALCYADVTLDDYHPDENLLRLRVPSKHVYEYLEGEGSDILRPALIKNFGKTVKLNYRILPPEPSFSQIADYLNRRTREQQHDPTHIQIADARKRLTDGLHYFIKDRPVQWLPGYDQIVRWLTDNDHRGLLCFGYPGTGKSLICQRILPILIPNGQNATIVKATELHDRLSELCQQPIVVIDDLGREPRKHYGDIDQSFFELCDNAERTHQLLIITTNLSTVPCDDPHYSDDICTRYGTDVLSRLQAITHTARIEGEDLR